MLHQGALAYSTGNLESGWIPVPTPGIYTSPELRGYRQWLPFFSFEAQGGLNGSYFSENIEDYYVTPYELGYGRSVSLEHDFIGRDALVAHKDDVRRTKVTLEIAGPDRDPLGDGFFLTHGRFRVEANGRTVGITYHTGPIAHLGVVLSLAIVDVDSATSGTEVTLVWGEHPGPGTDPNADLGFAHVRATVRPAPYNEFARTQYRAEGAS
jgi:vanillate/3-O-methylgallate O-demethylase